MTYTPSLAVNISSDVATATLVDNTVYTVRSNVRVYATCYKVDYNGLETSVALTSNTDSPQTVTSWSFPYGLDGSYKILFVIIEASYNAGTTYALYDAVYDGSNNVYRSKQAGNIGNALNNTTYWELISDPSSLASNYDTATESANISSEVYRRVLTFKSQQAYGTMISENCLCVECDDSETVQPYKIFSLWLNGAIVADTRVETQKGEAICRRIQSRFL